MRPMLARFPGERRGHASGGHYCPLCPACASDRQMCPQSLEIVDRLHRPHKTRLAPVVTGRSTLRLHDFPVFGLQRTTTSNSPLRCGPITTRAGCLCPSSAMVQTRAPRSIATGTDCPVGSAAASLLTGRTGRARNQHAGTGRLAQYRGRATFAADRSRDRHEGGLDPAFEHRRRCQR